MLDLEMETLARQARHSPPELGAMLVELRSRGATMLQCIRYVMINWECSLIVAQNLVVDSPAWADRKDNFLRQQQEAFEEFIADKIEAVESIQQTITAEGTQVIVNMRKIPEGER